MTNLTQGHSREKPHIVLISSSDPLDVHSFSGTIYYMARALEAEFPDLEIVRSSRPFWFQPLQRLFLKVTSGRIDPYYWSTLNGCFARYLARKWLGRRVVVIAIVNASLVAQLAKLVPVINISDSTFELMRTEHEVFWSLSKSTAAHAERDELNSVIHSVHNSFSSHWAAKSAVDHYGADPSAVSVISWGCNFGFIDASEARRPESDDGDWRLLFIGGEWERKGGDVVCAAAQILVDKGIPIRVDFVGAPAPRDKPMVGPFHHHGYLSKGDADQLALLRSLMRDADLLFLPTRRDCTPMVFAEANAYGTPALTRDVGGVSDVVHDGANGIVLPEISEPADFANAIEALWHDRGRYAALRMSARREYEDRLNWNVWAREISRLVENLASTGRI